jgi:lysophospholipase L1-like esterase
MLPPGQFELTGAGVGGNKVYDLYLRLERDVLDRHPDIVVVFVGVNDVWHKRTMGTGTDADKFVAFYDALITKMQDKGIRVILATPALIGEKTDCTNDLDGELNHFAQLIRDLAAAHKCDVVDLRREFLKHLATANTANAEKGILTEDRVHFTPEGNRLAAKLFSDALTGKQ